MLKSIKNFFDPTERELKRLDSVVQSINALEPEMKGLSDDQLRNKTSYFQAKLQDGLLWTIYSRSLCRCEHRGGS